MDGRAGAAAAADGIGVSNHGRIGDLASTYSSTQAAFAHFGDSSSRGELQLQLNQNYYYPPDMPAQGDGKVHEQPQQH
jgi:hypothetical protein